VAAGDWWRLLAAMFLHYGWLHLTMNMLGLLLLGPFVEKSLGRVKFVATYLFSGLVSMAFVASVTHWRQMGDELLVGASGSIMGLVGATAIVWLRNWQTGRSHVALQRLRRVGLVIALQMVFDLVTPQVSMAAHTSGVITGCVVALLLTAGDG
jgi:rhomboid protease GluP